MIKSPEAKERKRVYLKAYHQRPEAQERRRELNRSSERKEKARLYRQGAKYQERQAKRYRGPGYEAIKERHRLRQGRPEVKEQARSRQLKNKYGLTPEAFNALLIGQGDVCVICKTSNWRGRNNRPVIDHDHKTGNVRGILCSNCNIAIGMLEDDPVRTIRLADYLGKK